MFGIANNRKVEPQWLEPLDPNMGGEVTFAGKPFGKVGETAVNSAVEPPEAKDITDGWDATERPPASTEDPRVAQGIALERQGQREVPQGHIVNRGGQIDQA